MIPIIRGNQIGDAELVILNPEPPIATSQSRFSPRAAEAERSTRESLLRCPETASFHIVPARQQKFSVRISRACCAAAALIRRRSFLFVAGQTTDQPAPFA